MYDIKESVIDALRVLNLLATEVRYLSTGIRHVSLDSYKLICEFIRHFPSEKDIKARFNKLALLYHPDKQTRSGSSTHTGSTTSFELIHNAYKLLIAEKDRVNAIRDIYKELGPINDPVPNTKPTTIRSNSSRSSGIVILDEELRNRIHKRELEVIDKYKQIIRKKYKSFSLLSKVTANCSYKKEFWDKYANFNQNSNFNKPSQNTPMNKVNNPMNKVNSPMNKINSPMNKVNTPMNKVNSPMNKVNTPMNKVNTPMNKINSPMNKVNTPMNKINNPMNKVNTPMNKVNTPITKVNSPITKVNSPMTKVNIPITKVNTPITKVNTPRNKVNSPMTKVNTPITKVNTPRNKVNIPITKVNTPITKVNTPMNKINTPRNKVNIPITKVNTPITKVNTPMNKINTPMNKIKVIYSADRHNENVSENYNFTYRKSTVLYATPKAKKTTAMQWNLHANSSDNSYTSLKLGINKERSPFKRITPNIWISDIQCKGKYSPNILSKHSVMPRRVDILSTISRRY